MKDLPFADKDSVKSKIVSECEEILDAPDVSNKAKKINLRQKISELSEGRWTIVEDILIDLQVGYKTEILLGKRDKMPSVQKQKDQLEEEINRRYSDDDGLREILLHAVPSRQNIAKWIKQQDWKEEVEDRFRAEDLFSPDKRAALIQKLYQKATSEGNMKAAEMWLKMSGDLNNKDKTTDRVTDAYQKLQERLFTKKD